MDITPTRFPVSSTPRRDHQVSEVHDPLADAAFKAYQRIEYHNGVPLKTREAEIESGARLPTDEEVVGAKRHLETAGPAPCLRRDEEYSRETILLAEYPPTVRVKLQAIRIGQSGIVSSPCETFVDIGLAIERQSPLEPTLLIELANGYNGCLPTGEHHRLGGYETWRARSSYPAVDSATKVSGTLLDLLKEVSAE